MIVESPWKRWIFLLLAIAIAVSYLFFLVSFLAPAPGRPGIDENAYLVAGKNIAQHGTSGFKPGDDYQFVGAMWVRTASGWYYPKYGFGQSLLNAAMVFVHHREWAFFINPVCAAVAVLGIFFLARDLVGSFYGVLAMIVLATGPTTIQLADLPDSHASALCFVIWGMFFLLRWMRGGGWMIGIIAGLLLGYAVTIRYSEALLMFPLYWLKLKAANQFIGPQVLTLFNLFCLLPIGSIGIAAISRVRWKKWQSYFGALIPVIAWALPVAAQVIYNKFTIGHFTGYDDTNESSGFSMAEFGRKWEFAVHQIYVFGMFLIMPLGIVGLAMMFRAAARTALILVMWLVPGMLLYIAYYWGNNAPSVGFLRFLLTLFPPLILGAMWLLHAASSVSTRSISAPIASGILVAASAAIGIWGSLDELNVQHRGTMNMHYSAQRVMFRVKHSGNRPMILADEGVFPQFLQYMQFMLDADWYESDTFAPRIGGGFGIIGFGQNQNHDNAAPVVLQKARMEYFDNFRKGKGSDDFAHDAQRLMNAALREGRHVYAVIPPAAVERIKELLGDHLQVIELEHFDEPCAINFPDATERHWLTLRVWEERMFVPWHRQTRGIYEIRAKATTQPRG